MIKTASLAALLACVATAATAQESAPLFDRYFAERDGVLPCYAATFTPAEREAVPGREISRFSVRHSHADELEGAPAVFELVFSWSLYGATTWTAAEAQCAMEEEAADCLIEGDGANYRLSPDGDGLRFTATPLLVEIMDALTERFGDHTQAHSIRLEPADPAACTLS